MRCLFSTIDLLQLPNFTLRLVEKIPTSTDSVAPIQRFVLPSQVHEVVPDPLARCSDSSPDDCSNSDGIDPMDTVESQTESRDRVTCPLDHTASCNDMCRIVRRKKTALNKKSVQDPLYIFHMEMIRSEMS